MIPSDQTSTYTPGEGGREFQLHRRVLASVIIIHIPLRRSWEVLCPAQNTRGANTCTLSNPTCGYSIILVTKVFKNSGYTVQMLLKVIESLPVSACSLRSEL